MNATIVANITLVENSTAWVGAALRKDIGEVIEAVGGLGVSVIASAAIGRILVVLSDAPLAVVYVGFSSALGTVVCL